MIYDISYKTLIGVKPLHIRFDKIDEKYDAIYNRIRYLIESKNGTAYVISHNYAKIKVDSYDSLPLDKKLILHNIIINMMSVLDTEQNHNNYNIFLEKVHIN